MWNLSVVSSFSKILTILGAIFFFYLDHFIFQRKSSSFASSSIVVLSTLLKMQRGENKGFWEVIMDKNVDHYTCIVTQISSDICHNIPSSHLCLLKMKAIKFMKMIFSLGEGGGQNWQIWSMDGFRKYMCLSAISQTCIIYTSVFSFGINLVHTQTFALFILQQNVWNLKKKMPYFTENLNLFKFETTLWLKTPTCMIVNIYFY